MNTVKIDTIVRTIVLIMALVNHALTMAGKTPLPIADEEISDVVAYIFTTAASLWAWWKNNSFTKNAIEADKVLTELKRGKAVSDHDR